MFLTLDDIAVYATEMTARFEGNCKECGEYFGPGTKIKWLKPVGTFHIDCYEKYVRLESGLVEVLTLLLKSPSRAKEKLIRTLTHADPDQLYRATQKLLAAYGELVGFDLLDQAFSYENVEHEDLISTLNHKHKNK